MPFRAVRSGLRATIARIDSTYLLFFLSFGLFIWLVYFYFIVLVVCNNEQGTDIIAHATVARSLIEDHVWQGHFLYFLAVAILANFDPDLNRLQGAALIIISLSVVLKFAATRKVAFGLLSLDEGRREDQDHLTSNVVILAVFSLVFAFALPPIREWLLQFGILKSRDWFLYLGNTPPNVWHNSTIIFLMPFAIWLFWNSYLFLEAGESRRLRSVIPLVVVNILAKPSFFLAFAVAFPAMALVRFGLTRRLAQSAGVVLVGGIVLTAQFILVYVFPQGIEQQSGIAFGFLQVWRHYASSIPVSLLLSFAFPLTFTLSYYREIKHKLLFHYCLACLATALLIAASLIEEGDRAYDGNFFWQVIVCNYLLFAVCLVEFLGVSFRKAARGIKWHLNAAVYCLHLIGGVVYLQKFMSLNYH